MYIFPCPNSGALKSSFRRTRHGDPTPPASSIRRNCRWYSRLSNSPFWRGRWPSKCPKNAASHDFQHLSANQRLACFWTKTLGPQFNYSMVSPTLERLSDGVENSSKLTRHKRPSSRDEGCNATFTDQTSSDRRPSFVAWWWGSIYTIWLFNIAMENHNF